VTAAERWLIFDIDDTLIDTCGTGWRKCQETARRLGLSPPSRQTFERSYAAMPFAECVRRLHPGVDVSKYAAAYDELVDWLAPPLGQVTEAAGAATAAGFRLGILTNGSGIKTRRKLSDLGFADSDFGFICHRDNSPAAKPDVAAFRRLATEFGVNPGHCWYASDQVIELRAAACAGFGTIGVMAGRAPVRPAGMTPALVIPRLDAATRLWPYLVQSGPLQNPLTPVRHAGFDAAFVLLEHITTPAVALSQALTESGLPGLGRYCNAAFKASGPSELDDARTWTSDYRIGRALTGYYQLVLGQVIANSGHRVTAERRARIGARAIRLYTRPDNWRDRTGSKAVLSQCRDRGMSVGVLSNWQSDLDQILSRRGLSPLIDVTHASAACGYAKPDARAFRLLRHDLGARSPAAMVFCGDDPVKDAAGSLLAGSRAVLIDAAWDSPAATAAMEVIA
jgi:FMN phosphatase YigB (HAD superfamily)